VSLPSYQLGIDSEVRACQYLAEIGWQIKATRFRARRGEVDIVAHDGQSWVFVEVKASRKRPPYEALQPRQMARLRLGAQEYLLAQGVGVEVLMRFDLILLWGSPLQFEHLRDVF
jgi:putative endonuclease